MAEEYSWSCVVDTAGYSCTCSLALLHSLFRESLYSNGICIHTHHTVIGLMTGRESSTCCSRVSHKLVCRISSLNTYLREIIKIKLAAVAYPCSTDLLQTHTVTDHEDDVLYLLAFRFLYGYSLVRVKHSILVVFREVIHRVLRPVPIHNLGICKICKAQEDSHYCQ